MVDKCDICLEDAQGKMLIDSFLTHVKATRPLFLCNKCGRMIIDMIKMKINEKREKPVNVAIYSDGIVFLPEESRINA